MARPVCPKALQEGLKNVYENNDLWDVVVKSEGQTFKAHKLVLALQSDVFTRKFQRWDGPDNSVDLEEESAPIVVAMLHYMYRFDYEPPAVTSEAQVTSMMFHVRVYALAVKYAILELQELAAGKFEAVATIHWRTDEFVQAIEEIYTSTHTSEQALRKIAVKIACSNVEVLLTREDFSQLLDANGQFACAILKGLHSGIGRIQNQKCQCKSSCLYEESLPKTPPEDIYEDAGSWGAFGSKPKHKFRNRYVLRRSGNIAIHE